MNRHASAARDRSDSLLRQAETQGRSEPCLHPEKQVLTLITDLPYGPRAADIARSAVTAALAGAVGDDVLDDARLVASELATNAFVSGSPPLVLCLEWAMAPRRSVEVEITVTDGGCPQPHDPPSGVPPAHDAESGRGLAIVSALADAWSLTTSRSATRGWCRLCGPAAHAAPASTRRA